MNRAHESIQREFMCADDVVQHDATHETGDEIGSDASRATAKHGTALSCLYIQFSRCS